MSSWIAKGSKHLALAGEAIEKIKDMIVSGRFRPVDRLPR
jgi:DNA-binding FadR family transcriptional regulator